MVDTLQSIDGGFGFLNELIGIQMRNMEAIRQAQQKMLEGIGGWPSARPRSSRGHCAAR